MNQFIGMFLIYVVCGIPVFKTDKADKFVEVFKNNLLNKRAIG
jgi:hypothetical protein